MKDCGLLPKKKKMLIIWFAVIEQSLWNDRLSAEKAELIEDI